MISVAFVRRFRESAFDAGVTPPVRRFGRRKYLSRPRETPDVPPTRRRAVRLAGVALAGSLAGCLSGAVDVTDSEDGETTGTESSATTTDSGGATHSGTVQTTDQPTAYPVGAGTALPEGSVEFPPGPKSRPERPADLTPERVREYVLTSERRWVYNRLYRDDSTDVHQDCGVDSVTE
jgi:hypothetical protein